MTQTRYVDPDRLARREAAKRDQGRRRRRALLAVAAVAIAALAWFVVSLFQPFKGSGTGHVAVTIPRHAGVGDIADLLDRKGVVPSAFFFEARATISGKRGDLKPGVYDLKRDMSYGSVLGILSRGPAQNVVLVTVPEGLSRREIAPLAARAGLKGDYAAATVRSPLLDPARYGARGARNLEGFLFPSTYDVRRGPVKGLVAKQLTAFKQRFATVDLRAARHVNLTPYDVLTIASLVEREASAPGERALVAAVIYNRLRARMPLGIDASTRFALGKWSGALTRSDLASASPYNTRTHRGLPPGPIGNPGLAAIQAAAHPARVRYLYYVANPCKPGTHVFTTTAAAFDRAAARYAQARRRAGGRAPTHC
ncbi:MAG: endolytic transglycosylase MltG [Gaiellaceae bacterium]